MMKKIIFLLNFAFFCILHAQNVNPEISSDLPKVFPPSPSVSALMKFGEIAVNNYTGIPDISLPLINIPTHSKDIDLAVSIKYHPANVRADNIAGDVGLGWSLFAGGTISRVVKGLPDEELSSSSTPGKSRVGLYHTTNSNQDNLYYDLLNDPYNTLNNHPAIDEYLWETTENGKYDTQHDLWEFNFMGNSGQFMIEKNSLGNLVVVPLSDYRVKIVNHYETISNNQFIPSGFTVYDDKGYKYLFEVYEVTTPTIATETKTMINPIYNSGIISATSLDNEKEYRSAFHLTKVYDNNEKIVFEVNYNTSDLKESNRQITITRNEYGNDDSAIYSAMRYANCWSEIPPFEMRSVSNSYTSVKKISSIIVPERARIEFIYLSGRQDSNTSTDVTFLDKIILKNYKTNQEIYNYKFGYKYSELIERRMFLNSLTKSYSAVGENEEHTFYYQHTTGFADINSNNLGKDYWGYFNTYDFSGCTTSSLTFMNKPSAQVSTLDLLQKIKYPTSGSVIFKFEANTYSYIGDQSNLDFTENTKYSLISTENKSFNNSIPSYYLPLSSAKRRVVFTPSIVLPQDPNNWTRNFSLIKIVNGQEINMGSLHCVEPNANCCFDFILDENIQYFIRRNNFDLNYNGTDYLKIAYFSIDNSYQYLIGGGNRISKIAYFDQDVDQNYYGLYMGSEVPAKEKEYYYQWIDNPNRSSGSLAFGRPKFEENKMIEQRETTCELVPYSTAIAHTGIYSYLSRTTTNSQEMISTQGAHVGYKYVKIFETNKGTTEEEYTSPIDYPEDITYSFKRPYLPGKNFDYKRGLLKKQKIKDNNDRVLLETIFNYDFENYEKDFGYKFDKSQTGVLNGRLKPHTFMQRQLLLSVPQSTVYNCTGTDCDTFSKSLLSLNPLNYITRYKLAQAYGWAKLASKQTKNYFYENGNQKIVETQENFTYNNINKKIAEHSIIHPDGNSLKTKYYYDTGNNSVYSQNRISEIKKIESFKNNMLVETKEIDYSNTWNDNISFLPKLIKQSYANNPLQTELTYDQYDSKGNLQQYTTKDGIPTAIIWGYNQTQPIAKITGATYAQVSSLAAAIISASDLDASNPSNEAALITALDNFRKDSTMAGYQISTYTYDPLIGVTTITPPSGIREVYLYDTANRLKEIRENSATGKLLKEFKYNYKN